MTDEQFYQAYCTMCGTLFFCSGDKEKFKTCGYYRKEVLHLEPPKNPCTICFTDIHYCNRSTCSSYRDYINQCIDQGYPISI